MRSPHLHLHIVVVFRLVISLVISIFGTIGCFEGSIINVDLLADSTTEGGIPDGDTASELTGSSDDPDEENPLPTNSTDSSPSVDTSTGTDSATDTVEDPGGDPGEFIDDSMWGFFSIADMQDGPSTGENHIRSMYLLDPGAVALFEVGDLTQNSLAYQWEAHHMALQSGSMNAGGPSDHYRVTAEDWGDYTRFIGVLGNHDIYTTTWLSDWNNYLPGQRHLGVNGYAGVYFTVLYQDTLFIILDSNHYSEAQTQWLADVLNSRTAQSAKWKIAMSHAPVYPCSTKEPQDLALPWVALFEEHGVDLVLHGHSHTFERTCPMKNGTCVPAGEGGVVYFTASGGGTSYLRAVYPDNSDVLTYGGRTDAYSCTEILADWENGWNHFCHYAVGECRFIVRCFDHDYWAGGVLRHQFMLDRCE